MYLICYGTRPELIKLIPLIYIFKKKNIQFKTLFSGQHKNLIKNFNTYIDKPDFELENIMEHGQTLNSLSSKIIKKMDIIFNEYQFNKIVIQGDTTTAFSIALSAFHRNVKVIHLEAGLRTNNKYSPYPEELNRRMISQIATTHLCPTINSVKNLEKECITNNVYMVGNTIVDIYKYILENTHPCQKIKFIIDKYNNYIIVTLHRRENRGNKMKEMWKQINLLSNLYKFIYITHPSIPNSKVILDSNNITILEPLNYEDMVHLIANSKGIITDSGGLQEEAVCSNKKVLICRDTTERPETIECGLGLLIDTNITDNINFFDKENINTFNNPYGNNVCDKIIKII
tara:strand:- start:54345 stop:55376 length:1032 start_codon:yes stop_codon:yes gene_type:complete